MARPKKKNSSKKYYLSEKQLEREKKNVTKDVTDIIYQIMLVSFADEVEDSISKFDAMCKELRIGKERAEKLRQYSDLMMK